MNGISTLTKESLERFPSAMAWKRVTQPHPNHAGTLISDAQTPELQAIYFCSLYPTQSAAFCYSNLNTLRQWASDISVL